MIDCHMHLDNIFYYRDRNSILQKCRDNGVVQMINCGTSYESSIKSLNLAKEYEYIYTSVGVHPTVIDELDENVLNNMRILAQDRKVVAIGEIGLDYNSKECDTELQKKGFIKQVELAKELNLPIIVHSRNAHDDVIEILNHISFPKRGGMIHGFSGDENLAKKYIDLGLYISIAGNITYEGEENTLKVIENIDLEKILVETDSPFLAPAPFKNKRNYPGNIKFVVQAVAKAKNKSVEEISRITSENAKRLFNIKHI